MTIHRIVPMDAQHISGLRKVIDSVAKERRYLAMLEAPSMDETEKFFLGNIAAGNPQFVAIVDDKIVGWCDISPKPRPTLRHSGTLGMGVIAPYRGQGIGKSLIDAALKAAKANGLTRIELTVRVDNDRAKKLYESAGFVVEGICRRHMRVDGEYTDSYLMAVLYDER